MGTSITRNETNTDLRLQKLFELENSVAENVKGVKLSEPTRVIIESLANIEHATTSIQHQLIQAEHLKGAFEREADELYTQANNLLFYIEDKVLKDVISLTLSDTYYKEM